MTLTNHEKLREIVNQQLEKLHRLSSNANYILTDKEIKSVAELAKSLEELEKIESSKGKETESFTTSELLAIQEFRASGKWPVV